MTREPRKALKVNYETCHGVVAFLKERDRLEQSMASITKGPWIPNACAWICLGTDARRIPERIVAKPSPRSVKPTATRS